MKQILIIIFLTVQFAASAQLSSVSLTLSWKTGIINGKSFGKFVDSYNLVNPTNKTKLKNFGACSGWSMNADWWLSEDFFMGYYQHMVNASTTSVINNYETREFRLKQKTYGADFGGGHTNKKGGIVGFFGIYFSTANIVADFIYRDDYRSIGAESGLNGIYHGFGFSGSVGVKGYVFAGPIGFTSSLRWCPISGSLEMTDFGKEGINAQEYIPEDWGTFLANPPYEYQGENVKPNFQSFLLDLGIVFRISADN